MREVKYQILVGKFQGHGSSRRRSEDNNQAERRNGVGVRGLDLSLIIRIVPSNVAFFPPVEGIFI
jgi:hypothetical protein